MTATASISSPVVIAAPETVTAQKPKHFQRKRTKTKDTWQFRMILAATYPIFLTAAVAGRLTPQRLMRRDATQLKNVFAEARETASNTLPYAFMG
jgi:hypothetical protein